MNRVRARRKSGEGGVILVELVIVLPLLLMLAFGLCDMGLAWRDKVTVETAARAGARTGSNLGNLPLT
ncbi:MAG TPA: TadE family protein, partial [Acidimicrobiia bacterium]